MLVSKTQQWYGWKPDIPDFRDIPFTAKVGRPVIPQSVDLRKTCKMPDIFNQESLGSCTGNAISFAMTFNVLNSHDQTPFTSTLPFSRLFIYYNERVVENSVNQDAGAQIRDGFKAIASEGVCVEEFYPYDVDRFSVKPPQEAFDNALLYKAIEYNTLNNLNKLELIQCLMDGFPFVFGFSVYESFESDEVSNTGVVNIPEKDESPMGGHCVCCVGYDLDSDRFIIANSWGTDWGQDGYFTIPSAYLTSGLLAQDFWTVKMIM